MTFKRITCDPKRMNGNRASASFVEWRAAWWRPSPLVPTVGFAARVPELEAEDIREALAVRILTLPPHSG